MDWNPWIATKYVFDPGGIDRGENRLGQVGLHP